MLFRSHLRNFRRLVVGGGLVLGEDGRGHHELRHPAGQQYFTHRFVRLIFGFPEVQTREVLRFLRLIECFLRLVQWSRKDFLPLIFRKRVALPARGHIVPPAHPRGEFIFQPKGSRAWPESNRKRRWE